MDLVAGVIETRGSDDVHAIVVGAQICMKDASESATEQEDGDVKAQIAKILEEALVPMLLEHEKSLKVLLPAFNGGAYSGRAVLA